MWSIAGDRHHVLHDVAPLDAEQTSARLASPRRAGPRLARVRHVGLFSAWSTSWPYRRPSRPPPGLTRRSRWWRQALDMRGVAIFGVHDDRIVWAGSTSKTSKAATRSIKRYTTWPAESS
jgi:hypothetical protein